MSYITLKRLLRDDPDDVTPHDRIAAIASSLGLIDASALLDWVSIAPKYRPEGIGRFLIYPHSRHPLARSDSHLSIVDVHRFVGQFVGYGGIVTSCRHGEVSLSAVGITDLVPLCGTDLGYELCVAVRDKVVAPGPVFRVPPDFHTASIAASSIPKLAELIVHCVNDPNDDQNIDLPWPYKFDAATSRIDPSALEW